MAEMEYRRLGRSGLKVSVLSFGSWVTFANANQLETAQQAAECLAAAQEAGVNFFDNAEAYGAGESERVMGAAIRELGWERHDYVISTKLFWGLHDGAQHAQHAQPQVPEPGHRGLTRAPGPGLRRPGVLSPRRPEYAD